jgi:hypothetical protein
MPSAVINYDFTGLERAVNHLKNGMINRALPEIERELNKFFKDSKCTGVFFTKNVDKLFFGMTTYCILSSTDVDNILTDDKPVRVTQYKIEIDSKLLEVGFTTREITAILLHEVGHVVNDSTPAEEVRKAMDAYMVEMGTNLDITKSRNVSYLFQLAVADSIRKSTSFFTRKDEEILADEFVARCGYGPELHKAFKRLTGSAATINKNVDNKFSVLLWTLRIYTNIGLHRMMAIKVLNRAMELTGSKLEKEQMKKCVDALKTDKTLPVDEASFILQEADRKNSLTSRIRRSGLKGIEEDLYEYQMRIRNIDDEDAAIVLVRQLNSRISVLDDYLYNSQNINEREKARWESLLQKYLDLRDELASKAIYNHKQYGIFMDYNYAKEYQQGYQPYLT